MSSSRILAIVLGLSFFLPAFGTVQAATVRPAPIASGQSDVIDIRKRRYRRRGAIFGAIIGGAIIGGAIARDRRYHRGRRYHRNRYYNGHRRYRNRYYGSHRRYRNHRRYRRLQRGHYYVGRDSYDANGFLNEK